MGNDYTHTQLSIYPLAYSQQSSYWNGGAGTLTVLALYFARKTSTGLMSTCMLNALSLKSTLGISRDSTRSYRAIIHPDSWNVVAVTVVGNVALFYMTMTCVGHIDC